MILIHQLNNILSDKKLMKNLKLI